MAYWHRSRGVICLKSNSLSFGSWIVLSREPSTWWHGEGIPQNICIVGGCLWEVGL